MITKPTETHCATPATTPLALKSNDVLGHDGTLHADGYFTWRRRDGYVLDATLPAAFVLAEKAQAASREAQVGAAIAAVCDAEVLRCQVDSLRDALAKVLDTREAEAKANLAYEVALKNYSGPRPDNRRHLETMTKASNAENGARLLLATLKRHNVRAKADAKAEGRRQSG